MRNLFIFILLLPSIVIAGKLPKADLVIVHKKERTLYLIRNNETFKAYRIALGANPKGHKQQEGDERTPEGKYTLDYKKPDSAYYKAIHISYPNDKDRERARELGVHPGGFIMIHGQKNGLESLENITQRFDWTDGCIAVKNAEMDEIWSSVETGTPILIEP